MSSASNLADLRERWIETICTRIAASLARHPLLDPARIAADPRDLDLLRTLVVLRIAVWQAQGRSTRYITGMLAQHPVFADPAPDPDQLASLIEYVRQRMEYDGIAGSVLLIGQGLRAEDPESAYTLLLEQWIRRRSSAVGTARVVTELVRHWGAESPRAARAVLPGSLAPFQAWSQTIWSRLQTESDARVQNVASFALVKKGAAAGEQWTEQFGAPGARHLWELGSQAATCNAARDFLRTAMRNPRQDRAARPFISRALDVVDEHIQALNQAIGSLSAIERDLLRHRSHNERFQDACVVTFVNQALGYLDGRRPTGSCTPDAQALHGMSGSLPWWNIVVRTRDGAEGEAARAAVSDGVLPLGFEKDPARPRRLVLICCKPGTQSRGLRAHFVFDLDNPAHACELLLIARRPGLPIDVYAHERVDLDADDWDIESTHLGTLYAVVGPELAALLSEAATEALVRSLPAGRDSDCDKHTGIPPLTEVLRQLPYAEVEHYAPARRITAASPRNLEGGIAVEPHQPKITMAAYSKAARRNRRSSEAGQAPAATVPPPRTTGFVYIQHNTPDLLKIGYSDRLPEDRAKELYDTGAPFRFEVDYRALTSHPEDVEQAVHRLLAAQRVNPDREFFRVPLQTAIEAIGHCQEEMTGIGTWEPLPAVHLLRAGDRVVLPLRAGQVFTLTAHANLLSPAAEIVDFWQAHADGDLLEIHATGDPGHVAGFSSGDPGGDEDPVPFLNREKTTRNAILLGRERLVAGDRLVWFCDRQGPADAQGVVFEADAFCQVTYRTSAPRIDPSGIPLLLNHLDREVPDAMGPLVREVLALGMPRTWAPRDARAEDGWATAATHPQPPEYWLPPLERPRKNAPRGRR